MDDHVLNLADVFMEEAPWFIHTETITVICDLISVPMTLSTNYVK